MLLHKSSQHLIRRNAAPDAPFDVLGHVHAATSGFAPLNPRLRLANALRKIPLRESRLLPKLAQESRHGAINQRLISFYRHTLVIRPVESESGKASRPMETSPQRLDWQELFLLTAWRLRLSPAESPTEYGLMSESVSETIPASFRAFLDALPDDQRATWIARFYDLQQANGAELRKHLTVSEVATILKCSPNQVTRLIEKGRLPAKNVGIGKRHRDFRIDPTDLARLDFHPRTNNPQPARRRRRRGAFVPSLRIG